MRAGPIALLLLCTAGMPAVRAEQPGDLPTCTGLIPALQASSGRGRGKLLEVGAIVEDFSSTPAARLCTGVAHYKDGTANITFSARWDDAKRKSFNIDSHDVSEQEEASRGRTLRIKNHPVGEDGTFSLESYVPYCGDPEFIELAQRELRYGISFRGSFYKEPDYVVSAMQTNGYGSGILSNCVATMGDAAAKGEVFLGTGWATGEKERRYELYILEAGPDGWKLKNRIWELGTE